MPGARRRYGPGGNLLGELPFSPTVARKLGLRPEPCDGALSRAESRAQSGGATTLLAHNLEGG